MSKQTQNHFFDICYMSFQNTWPKPLKCIINRKKHLQGAIVPIQYFNYRSCLSYPTLPETNCKFASENRPFNPKGKDRNLPTIHFSGASAVSFREGISVYYPYIRDVTNHIKMGIFHCNLSKISIFPKPELPCDFKDSGVL